MADNRGISHAYMNQGRWVAHCLTDGCSGAERLWPGGTLRVNPKTQVPVGIADGVLHCHNCGRTSNVGFPENDRQITRILNRRPVPETRNWYPTETVDDLLAENDLHGVS